MIVGATRRVALTDGNDKTVVEKVIEIRHKNERKKIEEFDC